jgi:hypothetical protein
MESSFINYEEARPYEIMRKFGENDTEYVGRVITHVVTIEGPIHFDLLCKRLAYLFGNEKGTSVVKRNIEYFLNGLSNINFENDFCQLRKQSLSIKVRIPNSKFDIRKIEHICKEELAEAMLIIIKKSFGIVINDLFVETAKIFGFVRTSEKIRERLTETLTFLLKNGRVLEQEDKILIK